MKMNKTFVSEQKSRKSLTKTTAFSLSNGLLVARSQGQTLLLSSNMLYQLYSSPSHIKNRFSTYHPLKMCPPYTDTSLVLGNLHQLYYFRQLTSATVDPRQKESFVLLLDQTERCGVV